MFGLSQYRLSRRARARLSAEVEVERNLSGWIPLQAACTTCRGIGYRWVNGRQVRCTHAPAHIPAEVAR